MDRRRGRNPVMALAAAVILGGLGLAGPAPGEPPAQAARA